MQKQCLERAVLRGAISSSVSDCHWRCCLLCHQLCRDYPSGKPFTEQDSQQLNCCQCWPAQTYAPVPSWLYWSNVFIIFSNTLFISNVLWSKNSWLRNRLFGLIPRHLSLCSRNLKLSQEPGIFPTAVLHRLISWAGIEGLRYRNITKTFYP